MGYYVNPENDTKENWLHTNGKRVPTPTALPDNGTAIVCLVSNGAFTAAGIAYSEMELAAFADPSDRRPKIWFEVPKHLLYDVSNLPQTI